MRRFSLKHYTKNRKPRENWELRPIITHYGYCDGSGEYYISIDSGKCDGCGKCMSLCPRSALNLETILVDLEDVVVAAVSDEYRKKIKYTCSSCQPENGKTPCILACEKRAINCIWKPEGQTKVLHK